MSEGLCYERAAEWLLNLLPADQHGCVLVHGRPTLQIEPYIEYGHAWIERPHVLGPTEVVDPSQDLHKPTIIHANLYYALGRIDYRQCLVYTAREARQFLLQTQHYGPWEGPEGSGDITGLTRSRTSVDHAREMMKYLNHREA
jgi:hypothetical protein